METFPRLVACESRLCFFCLLERMPPLSPLASSRFSLHLFYLSILYPFLSIFYLFIYLTINFYLSIYSFLSILYPFIYLTIIFLSILSILNLSIHLLPSLLIRTLSPIPYVLHLLLKKNYAQCLNCLCSMFSDPFLHDQAIYTSHL